MNTAKLGELTEREAKVWQAAQLEIVEQLIEHGSQGTDLMGLLKDWKTLLVDNKTPERP